MKYEKNVKVLSKMVVLLNSSDLKRIATLSPQKL